MTPITKDPLYLLCIGLTYLSKNDKRSDETYGALIVDQKGKIIGQGFNRAISHPAFKLERRIRQGWVNHAEIKALNAALTKRDSVRNYELYVAGRFLRTQTLFFQDKYTCPKCIPYLAKYEIKHIYLPTPDGWIRKTLEQASKEAEEFSFDRYRKRNQLNRALYKFASVAKEISDPKKLIVLNPSLSKQRQNGS